MTKASFCALFTMLILLSASCNYFQPQKTDDVIARVGENYLYREDIEKLLVDGISKEDSANLTKSFIDTWATGKLLIERAEANLNQDKLDELEILVNQYRTDIYANAYKEILISTSIDTVVKDDELRDFYDQNNDNFILNEELLKLRYISVEKEYNLGDLKEKFNRFNIEDKEELLDIAFQFQSYSLNDSIWVKASEVIKRIPVIEADNFDEYLKKSQIFELTDSLGVYLVFVKEILNRNSVAPLEYVKPTIKQIITNKRKLEFKRRLEKEILDEAYQTKHYEIYE